ncbi:MAG: murein biosynthesis integral membrane protein MurJ [Phycisphaerae bacterium]|jgi:putative peptidoglycan lipid II flippase
MQAVSDKEHGEREHFFGAVKMMTAITLLSRILGLLRDITITSIGASRVTDAFTLAQKIPNLFRRLFGEGALSAAFVPVFTDTVEKEGFEKGKMLFANAMALLGVAMAGLMVVGGVVLAVWGLAFPGNWDRQLALGLTATMLPFSLLICMLALASAALNCRGHFGYPVFAPILQNILMLVAAVVAFKVFRAPRGAPHDVVASQVRWQLYVIAASVTFSGAVQLAGSVYFLRKQGFSLRLKLRPVEPGIKPMLKQMLPMLIGLGFLQISEVINDMIAWTMTATAEHSTMTVFGKVLALPLTEGVLVRVQTAQRLYQFPMGVLAISLGTAIFPLLSRYASRGDMPNLRDALNRAVRLAMMEGLATGLGLFILAEPIMRMLFAWRNFTVSDAAQAAFVLQMYVLGMWAYCSYQMFVRAFYALKDTVTPLKISCALVLPNMAMFVVMLWVPQLGPGAYGVATAVTFSANTLILAYMFRRRVGLFGGRKLAVSVLRSLAACAVMGAVIWPLKGLLAGRSDLLIVAVCVTAGAIAFLVAAKLLRAPEIDELLQSLRKRRRQVE